MANSNGWGDGAANNAIGWGQGANNAIGWGDIHADSWAGLTDISGAPSVDADAQAFITAASITDATQQSAINQLVVDLKGYGVWSKMKALYPFVGGTASTHKFNLKDPRDLDAAFRLVFSGGWTHSSTGATPNGTNGYADTKLNPNNILTNNNTHLSYYSRSQVTNTSSCDIGCSGVSQVPQYTLNLYYSSLSEKVFVAGSYPTLSVRSSNTNTLGLQIGSRTSSTSAKLYMNSSLLSTNNSNNTTILPNINMYIAANRIAPSNILEYSNKQCAFASIGDGLSDTEAANFYTAVQAFQVALNRNI